MRKVWVRGMGAVTPLGMSFPDSAAALAEGRSAIAPVAGFDVTGFPCSVAAAVPRTYPEEDRRLPLAREAARQAWREAEVQATPERIGVFVGAESGRGSWRTVLGLARAAGGGDAFDAASFGRRARPFVDRIGAEGTSPAAVASALAGELGARGPVETISLACASSGAALVEAARAIRLGQCDVALAGGVGADVDPLMLAGFGLLGALSARGVSCPFDVRRDGFVVGEGAAMVVLAVDRGDSPLAEVAGLGRSLDAFHLTAPDADGDGAARAMKAALDDAGLDEVDVVQAHGTSTPLNDAVEALALHRVLGASLARAQVSSVKGALGHWVAGAGALGFLCAVWAVARGEVFPTAGLVEPDPACALPHVLGRAVRRKARSALVNSFAFGGANTSIVVRSAG